MQYYLNKKSAHYVLIDTYSGNGFYFALICSLLCLILNIKYILILRGGNLEHRLKNYSFLSRLLFANSYLNIAPSIFMKEIFKNMVSAQDTFQIILKFQNISFKVEWVLMPQNYYGSGRFIKFITL